MSLHSNRGHRCAFETLENRWMLTGNVTAQIANGDPPAVEQFEKIDTPQQRGLAASGRTHDHRQVALRKFKSEVVEESVAAE